MYIFSKKILHPQVLDPSYQLLLFFNVYFAQILNLKQPDVNIWLKFKKKTQHFRQREE